MSVEFNENRPNINFNYSTPTKNGFITNLVIKMGLAKDEKSANTVMVIFVVICFALSIYLVI